MTSRDLRKGCALRPLNVADSFDHERDQAAAFPCMPVCLQEHAAKASRRDQPDEEALCAHGENSAEPHFAAVHLLVGFGHAAQRKFLNHRVHASQRTKF